MALVFMLHARLPGAIILFALACAAGGLWAGGRKQALASDYWGALVAGELLIIAQGVSGLALAGAGAQPGQGVHFLYGAVTALAWPAACAHTRGRDERRETLAYSLASLLIAALAARAIVTA